MAWDTATVGDIAYHKFFRQTQDQFRESNEIASWGNWYLATRVDDGVSCFLCFTAYLENMIKVTSLG